MPNSANLNIDPDGVRAAGATLSGATSTGPAPPAVTPCAADSTSVKIANSLTASISELVNATTVLGHKTAQASGRLSRNADNYETQEQDSAATLANGSRAHPAAIPVTDAPNVNAPVMVTPPAASAGVPPSTGKEIAALDAWRPWPGASGDGRAGPGCARCTTRLSGAVGALCSVDQRAELGVLGLAEGQRSPGDAGIHVHPARRPGPRSVSGCEHPGHQLPAGQGLHSEAGVLRRAGAAPAGCLGGQRRAGQPGPLHGDDHQAADGSGYRASASGQ